MKVKTAAAIIYPLSSILVFSELRGTRLMHREKPHKLLQVGVIPTPATIYIWEMIRLPDCKSGVAKQIRKRRTGALPAFPTSLHPLGFGSVNHFGSVAQSEEQPVVCGKAEGASPFGSANFKPYREADSQGFGFAHLHSRVP